MKHFIDSATQMVWAFEDNVVVNLSDGVYSFSYVSHRTPDAISRGKAISGKEVFKLIDTPKTLVPYDVPAPLPESVAEAALASAKALKKSKIKAYRDAVLLVTPFNGARFQSDLASKLRIFAVADSPSLPEYASRWRTADNTYVDMTLQQFVELKSAIVAREGLIFAAASSHQDAVSALTSADQVESYDYSQGWPA